MSEREMKRGKDGGKEVGRRNKKKGFPNRVCTSASPRADNIVHSACRLEKAQRHKKTGGVVKELSSDLQRRSRLAWPHWPVCVDPRSCNGRYSSWPDSAPE